MSRIVQPTRYGSPDVLTVSEVARPRAAEGDVVVEVRAAGVNPVDWKLYSGSFHDVDDDHKDSAGLVETLPAIGLECAGVVVEVGSGVEDVRVGDEVIVYPVTAAYADYVTVSATSILPKPEGLGWSEAGGLMLAATTAAHALHVAAVRHGETVLVHGASGGVGLMAVQLARALGAQVVATAAERNHSLLSELGAIPVVYGEGLAERVRAVAHARVSAAVDTAGTDEALDVSLELVRDPDRIVSITGSERRAQAGIKLLGYGPGQDAGTELRSAARRGLAARAGRGDLRVIIADTFPLARAADAHRLGLRGHRPGKIVLLT